MRTDAAGRSQVTARRLASRLSFFFFNDTATTEIYTFPYTTLFRSQRHRNDCRKLDPGRQRGARESRKRSEKATRRRSLRRSEEHTSELQSQSNLVCRLLLEKKKKRSSVPNGCHANRTGIHPMNSGA